MTETPPEPGPLVPQPAAVPAWTQQPTAWAPAVGPAEPPRPPEPRPRRVAVAVLSVLLVLVLAAGAWLTWYLLRLNSEWQDHASQWQALAEQHGAELAQTRAELEATRTELASVQDQLATAQERITQLADEKAQLGDESAAQQQLADYQSRVSRAAGQVATALATCIDGQERLIGYLEDAARWDPVELAAFRTEVDRYCSDATKANAQLQAELDR